MPEVTGYTTDKVDELLATSVVSGDIDSGTGQLTLTTNDGTVIDVGMVLTSVVDASTSVKGIIEIATDVESAAGTDSSRAVSPFGLAAVVATATSKGLVELATNAETFTGTDTVRAVTPADLKSVRVVSGILESATGSTYPAGTSVMALAASAWSLNSGTGVVVTNVIDATHVQQAFYTTPGGTHFSQMWNRSYNSGDGGWTAWQQIAMVAVLDPTSFTETTAFTSYPLGTSRLYFTTSNASTWAFTGKAGEVVTFRDGTDFAVQTWRWHNAGSGNYTETWSRTANAASGWSRWTKFTQGTLAVKYQSIGAVAASSVVQFTVTLPKSMIDTAYVVNGTVTEKNDGTYGSANLILCGAQPLSATTVKIAVYNSDTHAAPTAYFSYACVPVQG
jgi:hypothetical protein